MPFLTMKNIFKLKHADRREYVNGKVDTPYEYFMLGVIIINTISLGLETSRQLSDMFRTILFWIDQCCLVLFIVELIFKAIVYNREFFAEKEVERGSITYHLNYWNISDLIIVVVSIFSSLPYFAVFRVFRVFRSFRLLKMLRSLRIVKTFKLVNDISSLRRTFKGFVKAIPGILWTFCFLLVFAYVYAIIGTNVFGEEFPELFETLGTSFLTLCQIITFDSWVSQITRPIVQEYHWAWFYFVSYAFTAAYVRMNVIVGIIVDSMGNVSKNNCDINAQSESKKDSIEMLSTQISDLQNQIAELKEILKKN